MAGMNMQQMMKQARKMQEQLAAGYLSSVDFVNAGEEIQNILLTLPKLKPFDTLDTVSEKQRISEMFTEENAELLPDYFIRRGKAAQTDGGARALGILPKEYDKVLFKKCETLCATVLRTLRFYDAIPEDMRKAFEQLKKFVSRVDEADRFDERHLLPIATEVFGSSLFPLHTEYLALPKRRNSHILVTARRMAFESYYSFVLTDFFEGLHHGHYPRQCEICGQYFLMQSARRQKYCSYGIAPELYRGKKITCRKYAAVLNRKEKAENDPIVTIYNRRCGAIRTEVGRCTISKAFGEAAKHLAKEHKLRALADDQYAKTQYKKDMSREALYVEVDRNLK